ncbi:MAG: RICIN domain-containing protein [Ruminococcus sp.]|nr:RICIN domain-containing protein [Ruminococcus sp.]
MRFEEYRWDAPALTFTYLDNGYYSIVVSGTDMCLDVPLKENVEAGTRVEYYYYSGKSDPANTSINQQWSVEPTDGGYRIKSRYCSMCLDMLGGLPVSPSELGVFPQNNEKNQLFTIIPAEQYDNPKVNFKRDTYYVRSAASKDLWLDVEGYPDSFSEGSNIAVYNQNDDKYIISFLMHSYCTFLVKRGESYLTDLYIGMEVNPRKYADGKIPVVVRKEGATTIDLETYAQDWFPIENSDGSYTFVSRLNGYALTLDGYDVCAKIRDGSVNQNWFVVRADRLPGDVTNDGTVDIRDVTRLKQYLAKWNVPITADNADVDGQAGVTVKDLTLLKQYLAKWNVTLK